MVCSLCQLNSELGWPKCLEHVGDDKRYGKRFEEWKRKQLDKARLETAKQIDKNFKATDFYNKISTKQQEQYNKIMAKFLQEKDKL